MRLKWMNILATTAIFAGAAITSAQVPDGGGIAKLPLATDLTLSKSTDKKLQNSSGGTYLGVEAGAYFPIDTVIRKVFGSTVPSIGINFFNNSQADQLKTSVDFSVIGANKGGNRFLAIPVTLGVGRQYGTTVTNVRPYWRAGAGAAYLDYSIDPNNSGTPTAAHKVALTAIGEVGILLSDRVRLSASYNYFSKQDDFNFTGWDLKLSFLFWKL